MGATTLEPLLRYLRRLGPADDATDEDGDGALLARFCLARDEAAFEILVRRHGPLVWGVCTRLLGAGADAEDAFQATFLVLVRKAHGLRRPERLGPWLYGVARRVALRIRAAAARRREQALEDAAMATGASPDLVWKDLRPVLDEEVGRLPEKYRMPFILCYLEGLTNEEAARRLRCPTGTVLSRLSRARERLRGRLTRRGVGLGSAALGAALAAGPGKAAVPPALIASTVRTALAVAAGTGLTTTALTVAEGVLHAMYLSKLKFAVLGMLALAVLGSGAGLLARRTHAQESGKKTVAAPAAPKDAEPKKEAPEAPPPPKGGTATAVPDTTHGIKELNEKLRNDVPFAGFEDPKTTLADALDVLSQRFGVTFDVNEKAFTQDNVQDVLKTEIAQSNPIPPMKAPLAAVLRKVLSRINADSGATWVLRRHAIEITTQAAVRAETGVADKAALLPLVHEDFDDVPLPEAMKRLAERTGLSLVLDTQALKVNAAAVPTVTASLRNVPVDRAARILADSANCGAAVVGNVLYLTTPEKAERMLQAWRDEMGGGVGMAPEEKKPGRPSPGDAANPAAETGPAKKPAGKDAGRSP
jgi:RNA polymerase sigma factor (sigma-70 family)